MKLEAGQWWCMKDEPSVMVWSVGLSACGNWVIEWSDGTTSMSCPDDFYHEPRCTGWDWVVPEPQPAEDPDEWVIQDRVPVRPGIDQVCWNEKRFDAKAKFGFIETHSDSQSCDKMHGDRTGGIFLSVRCRRRDLPKVEQAEQWPKYYKPSQPRKTGYGKHVAYYKCSEAEKGETVHTDGTSFGFTVRAPGLDWTEITEAEAMLLLDKPTEPESKPQPQKTRVRLFRSLIDGLVVAENKCPDSDWQEIHHDFEGFYVEGGQS